MSVQVEKLEKNMAKLTVEVPAENFEKALDVAYNKQKNSISLPGFRKGKVPRNMVEKMYGVEIFYEDAANQLLQEEYPKAYDESGLEIVSQPKIDVVQIEKGKPFIFTAEVAVKPEVTLGKYVGVTVTKIDTSVSDEEIEAEITSEREKNGRTITVERAIEKGDVANIDFEGFSDGKAFEGGKGEKFDLEIGSHSFIDTFEDQLIGKKTGDDVEVHVTFPTDYQAKDLAGKEAMFKVKINEVKTTQLPNLDDEFVQDVSECDTVEAYKEEIKKRLTETKEAEAKRTKEDEAIAKIVEKSKMDIPDPMLDAQVDNMLNEFANSMAQQGLTLEQYMQFTGMTLEKFKEQVRPDALRRIQTSLCLEQIAKEENIEVTEEELNGEIEKMAAMYGMEAEQLKGLIQGPEKENMEKDIAVQKAVDFVMENAKERAKAKAKSEDDTKEKEEKKSSKETKKTTKKTTKDTEKETKKETKKTTKTTKKTTAKEDK